MGYLGKVLANKFSRRFFSLLPLGAPTFVLAMSIIVLSCAQASATIVSLTPGAGFATNVYVDAPFNPNPSDPNSLFYPNNWWKQQWDFNLDAFSGDVDRIVGVTVTAAFQDDADDPINMYASGGPEFYQYESETADRIVRVRHLWESYESQIETAGLRVLGLTNGSDTTSGVVSSVERRFDFLSREQTGSTAEGPIYKDVYNYTELTKNEAFGLSEWSVSLDLFNSPYWNGSEGIKAYFSHPGWNLPVMVLASRTTPHGFWDLKNDFIFSSLVLSVEMSDPQTEPVPEPVPEPSTVMLLGVGFLAMISFRHRKKK